MRNQQQEINGWVIVEEPAFARIVKRAALTVPEKTGTYAPDPLGLVKNVQNAVVSPSSKVEIHFDAETNVEELHVTRWGKDDGNQEKVSVSEHSFVLPAEPGKYVYEIVGKWSVGDGRYAVGFEVKQ